ncbi:MAG: CBS domain-containing protein [Anaerovorax sp.]
MIVKNLMSTSIVCARKETPVHLLARQMKQENIGLIPICSDRNQVLGVVTDRDIVLRCVSENDIYKTAEEIMTNNVAFVSPTMDTHHAALLLAKHQVRRLPVLENGKLIGMLALADIARKKLYIDEAGDALSSISKIGSLS